GLQFRSRSVHTGGDGDGDDPSQRSERRSGYADDGDGGAGLGDGAVELPVAPFKGVKPRRSRWCTKETLPAKPIAALILACARAANRHRILVESQVEGHGSKLCFPQTHRQVAFSAHLPEA